MGGAFMVLILRDAPSCKRVLENVRLLRAARRDSLTISHVLYQVTHSTSRSDAIRGHRDAMVTETRPSQRVNVRLRQYVVDLRLRLGGE